MRFAERMKAQTKISEARLEKHEGPTVLSLHTDPNLGPLERVERIARDTEPRSQPSFDTRLCPFLGWIRAPVRRILSRQGGDLVSDVADGCSGLSVTRVDAQFTEKRAAMTPTD